MSDKRRFRLRGRKKAEETVVPESETSAEVIDAEDESAATSSSDETIPAAAAPERPGRSLFKRRRRRGADAPIVGAGLMRPFNLAPQPIVVEKTPTIGVGKLVAVGVVLAGVVALGLLYVNAGSSRDAAATERDDVRELLERPAPAVGGAAPDDNETALFADQLFRETAIAGVLTDRVSWDRVLASVARISPADTSFTTMIAASAEAAEAAPAPPPAPADGEDPAPAPAAPVAEPEPALPTIAINGFADDHETLAVLIGRLSALRELEGVTLDSSGGTLIGETPAVQFSISAFVTPGRTS